MLKLLLDANLSYRLVKKVAHVYPECKHVTRTGLPIPAKDNDIWNWAKTNGYIIITNDEDFDRFLSINGFPPKVILLQMGNQSTSYIATILIHNYDEIKELSTSEDFGLLELF